MPRDAEPRRRLLLISYWFPPAIGAAAERMEAFARYLPQHGWHVDVLTAGRSVSCGTAAFGSEGSGSTASVVCPVRDPFGGAGDAPFADYDPRRRPSRWRSVARELIFPDRFRGWQRRAFAPAVELVRSRGSNLILASFPPASAVQLALRVHEATGIPLALDFRDLWIGPGGYEPRFGWVRRAHEQLRRRAIEAASLVVVVSEAMADALAAEGICPRDRIAVIPNGYEPGPVAQRSSLPATVGQRSSLPTPCKNSVTIAHVGTVIPRNRPDLFFESLRELQERGKLADVRFRFVGNLSADYIRSLGLQDIVETTGLVPREAARREMAGADALLLLVGSYVGRWGHNAKLFEYLQAGRPILCLEEEAGSNDRRLLEEFARERLVFAALDDPAGIADAVGRLRGLIDVSATARASLPAGLEAYNRERLAEKLAAALSRMTAKS